MSPAGRRSLLDHVLVPVAHPEDARRTARALTPYEPNRITTLHVVEKGGGVPDKSPVEYSEELADSSYAAFREIFPDAEEHTTYGVDVVDAIVDVADSLDASAIAFRSQGGGRLVQLLSGDRTLKLVTRADRPVIALPVEDATDRS